MNHTLNIDDNKTDKIDAIGYRGIRCLPTIGSDRMPTVGVRQNPFVGKRRKSEDIRRIPTVVIPYRIRQSKDVGW